MPASFLGAGTDSALKVGHFLTRTIFDCGYEGLVISRVGRNMRDRE
jgi:hypothetical protein